MKAVAGNLFSSVWRLLVLVSDLVDRARVEIHGAYSQDRLHELAEYAQHPYTRSRAVLIAILMALPSFVALVVVDALPMNPVQGGIADQTAGFWVRSTLTGGSMAGATFLTMVESVPELDMSSTRLWLIGPVIGALCLPVACLLSNFIGFPVPFALILNAPNWCVLMIGTTLGFWKDTLRSSRKTRQEVLNVLLTFSGLFTTIFVYTALSYLFSTLSASTQSVVSCLLPLVKVAFKNWINAGLHHSPHLKPISSVFSLDLFHAMFISTAMQQNVAGSALLITLGVDILLSMVAVSEVYFVVSRIRTAMKASYRARRQTERLLSQRRKTQAAVKFGPIAYAVHVLETSECTQRLVGCEPFARGSDRPRVIHVVQRAPKPQVVPAIDDSINSTPSQRAALEDPERVVVELVLKMLYMSEFYILTEYAETIVAFIYGMYLYTLSFLPNRIYYPLLALLSPVELRNKAIRILAYGLLEMLSLVAFCVVLGRVIGHHSPIGQLGFVLEKHWRLIQSLLVTWITFCALSTVQHLGADYTFEFKWLEPQNGGT